MSIIFQLHNCFFANTFRKMWWWISFLFGLVHLLYYFLKEACTTCFLEQFIWGCNIFLFVTIMKLLSLLPLFDYICGTCMAFCVEMWLLCSSSWKEFTSADSSLDPKSSLYVVQLLEEALRCPSDGVRKGQVSFILLDVDDGS